MNIEKMVYDSGKVRDCLEMVKAKSWTVKRKAEHFQMFLDLKEIYEFAESNINSFIFDTDASYLPLGDYSKLFDVGRKTTKKEMDEALRQSVYYLKWSLIDILDMIKKGEVEDCNEWAGVF